MPFILDDHCRHNAKKNKCAVLHPPYSNPSGKAGHLRFSLFALRFSL